MSHRYSKAKPDPESQSQIDKFRDLARQLQADEDPEAFKEKVKKVAGTPHQKKPDGRG